MYDDHSYHIALQAVKDGDVPTFGFDVMRMVADKHATVTFHPARTWAYGKCSMPDRYKIRLTDAGEAALRAFKEWPQ